MDTILFIIIGILAGAGIGFGIAKMLEKKSAASLTYNAKKEAASILKNATTEGENLKKDKELRAKEKFLELKAEHEQIILGKDKKISEAEKRTRDKESQVSSELARAKKAADDSEAKEIDRRSLFVFNAGTVKAHNVIKGLEHP